VTDGILYHSRVQKLSLYHAGAICGKWKMSDPPHPPPHHGASPSKPGRVVKVILLANGIGANPISYRPNADESQWWNRRDALVRCVIAYLFCYQKNVDVLVPCSRKELIIVFDEDWSTLSMRYEPKRYAPRLVPTEQVIIDLWKRATKHPGISVEQHGLSCICTTMHSSALHSIASQNPAARIESGSKRELLDYLHSTCSMEFLRNHKYVPSYHKSTCLNLVWTRQFTTFCSASDSTVPWKR
jgi:hypothetical protein